MIIIKGWKNSKNMCITSKACEHITAETAMMLIEASRTGPAEGRIRMPGGMMMMYNRYRDGRIVIRQI